MWVEGWGKLCLYIWKLIENLRHEQFLEIREISFINIEITWWRKKKFNYKYVPNVANGQTGCETHDSKLNKIIISRGKYQESFWDIN